MLLGYQRRPCMRVHLCVCFSHKFTIKIGNWMSNLMLLCLTPPNISHRLHQTKQQAKTVIITTQMDNAKWERILKVKIHVRTTQPLMKWLFWLFRVSTNICLFFSFLVFFFSCTTRLSNFTHTKCLFRCLTMCLCMRFELCHPPKHFIPEMKIYKNDCR